MRKADIRITIIQCGDEEITITTTRKPGENDADFEARHQAAVKQAEEDCESQ